MNMFIITGFTKLSFPPQNLEGQDQTVQFSQNKRNKLKQKQLKYLLTLWFQFLLNLIHCTHKRFPDPMNIFWFAFPLV